MKYSDFIFGSVEVEVKGRAYDLHNSFDFKKLVYDVEGRNVELVWAKNAYAVKEEPAEILIEFRKVTYFSAEGRDSEMPFSEDDCLASVSYVSEEEAMEESYYVDDPTEDLHCVLEFQSGFKVRLFSSEVRCAIQA